MKATVSRLMRIARTGDNQRRLRELGFAYADIADVSIAALRWDQVVLDRTNSRWRELHQLARLLLGDRFQTTSDRRSNGFSLLFEMNTLFEEYVARMLKWALVDDGLRVVTQGGCLFCLGSQDNHGLFQTRPDIPIKRGDAIVQVIDTKWKRIAAQVDDLKQGVSQADVYQMIAYGRLYGCDKLTLLYPHHAALGPSAGILNAHKVTATNHRLEIATINVAALQDLARHLRELTVATPRRQTSCRVI